jgi:hypothetical protein
VPGDSHAARTAWQQALSIPTDLNHPDTDRPRAELDAADVTVLPPSKRSG